MTLLHVICGLPPPNQKFWLRLCMSLSGDRNQDIRQQAVKLLIQNVAKPTYFFYISFTFLQTIFAQIASQAKFFQPLLTQAKQF